MKIDEVLESYHKWLYFENDCDITIPLAFVLSNFTDADPSMLGIIGPSGSYKTEFIRSLGEMKNDTVFPIDNLSSKTLISGFKEVEEIIPQLNKRLITIKDFTSIFAKHADEKRIILSDLRDIMDGYINRYYGNGVKREYQNIHSSVLFGSTSAIEKQHSLFATLGTRIMFYKPKNNKRRKVMQRAFDNSSKEKKMREELFNATKNYINSRKKKAKGLFLEAKKAKFEKSMKDKLLEFSDLVATLRTYVQMDRQDKLSGVSEPEFGTRIAKDTFKIIACHSLLYDREINQTDIDMGFSFLFDNVPKERKSLLFGIKNRKSVKSGSSISTLAELSDSHYTTTKRVSIQLLSLGAIKKVQTVNKISPAYEPLLDEMERIDGLFV